MTVWPDVPRLEAFFGASARRLTGIAAIEGAAAGLIVAAVAVWVGASPVIGIATAAALAVAGGAVSVVTAVGMGPSATRRHHRVASAVEQRAPQCRNVVITAAELMAEPARVTPYVGELVCREASRAVAGLDPAVLFPARRAAAAVAMSAGVWVLALVLVAGRPATGRIAAVTSAAVSGVELTVTPPAYTAQPARSLRDPQRVDALAGSRVDLTVHASAASVTIETIAGKATLARSVSGAFTGAFVADADGYVAIEPLSSDGRAGVRRLIGLTVAPDQAPRVKVTTPGRDLFVPDGHRTLDLAVEADDDIGLASLRLRYTKVSGSGEQFTFTEGEVPLDITRSSARVWNARATWRLDALALAPGDLVVYRGVAADYRPGAPPSESDAFIVEVAAPGSVAAPGFAADDEHDRYALSEQMIVLKTEKLAARKSAMAADAYGADALDLAVEQRRVRAEFVFMMGGEMADEVVAAAGITDLNEVAEAEAEADIAAGRLANQGRAAVILAIRAMSRASASLTTVDLSKALVEERAAVAYLERAFSRSRYILRALTQREALDLSRRLTGPLAGAMRDVRPIPNAGDNPRVTALRSTLASVATLGAAAHFGADAEALASSLAQGLLKIDPSSEPLRQVAAALIDAGAAMRGGASRTDDVHNMLDRAATGLSAVVRADLPGAPAAAPTLDADRLAGALADALRRAPRTP